MNLFSEEARRHGFCVPLHALRGLAAILVLMGHIQQRIEEAFPHLIFPHIFNGSGAVNFFYVLSGLVVGASLAKVGVSSSSLTIFFHRRVFRIMPLMFVTVTIGGLYLLYVDPHMKYPIIPKEYGEFSLLKFLVSYIGYSLKPNPPIWSIFVELVASLLIPLMILSGNKIVHMMLAALACVLLSFVPFEFQHHWNFYMISFYLGLTVLVWGKWMTDHLRGLSSGAFWLLFAAMVIPFYLTRKFTGAGFGDLWIVYWETALITPVVAIIFYMPERFSVLYAKVFTFLGDVSFSLYLSHFLLLILLLNGVTYLLGNTNFAAFVFCGVSVIASLAVAAFAYRGIELNGMKMGDHLRKRFQLARQHPDTKTYG